MYDGSPDIPTQTERGQKLWDDAVQEDLEYQEEGWPPYFKKPTPTSRGTQAQFDFLIDHIKLGDYQDLLTALEIDFH
jgi:hypothetical protein